MELDPSAEPTRAVPGADAYELVSTPGGVSLRSRADGETFHPVAGPEREAQALYVEQLGLRERASRAASTGEVFVIWDVGLGAGGNVCTVLRALAGIPVRLRVVSFEHRRAPLEFALAHADSLPFLRGFDAALRGLLSEGASPLGPVGLDGEWQVQWGDFPGCVSDPRVPLPGPDVVLFDAFSPARNPAMWSLPVFRSIRGRVGLGRWAQLATFSRATLVRTALLLAGWHVGRGEAVAGKEETTVASTDGSWLRDPLGASFLRRAEVSDAAEPLDGGAYRRARLSPASALRLRGHPQFRGIDPAT